MKGNIYFCCLQVFFLAWTSGQAATITLDVSKTSSYVLGDVIPGLTGGGQEGRDQTMVNQLVGIYNGTISPAAPYFLSGNNFGSTLGQAITTGDIVTAAGGIVKAQDGNATLTLGSGFTYLIAQYHGPNGGAVVWDIAGLASRYHPRIPMVCSTRCGRRRPGARAIRDFHVDAVRCRSRPAPDPRLRRHGVAARSCAFWSWPDSAQTELRSLAFTRTEVFSRRLPR